MNKSLSIAVALCLVACPSPTSTSGAGDDPPAVLATCDVQGTEARLPPPAARPSGVPRLDCNTAAIVAAPSLVQVEGCIDIFGVGLEVVAGVEVAIFDRSENPTTAVPLAQGAVALGSSSQALACGGADADAPACRALGCDSGGFYRALGDVPTDTPVIFRITATNPSVVRTFLYDVVLATAAIDDDSGQPRVNYQATLIYASTYSSLPSLGGSSIQGGADISDLEGRGIIAGEIRDCDDLPVQNAVVVDSGADPQSKLVYFNGSTTSPGPDGRNTATSSDGRYANLNVTTAGETHVIAAGIRTPGCDGDDCACVSLGTRSVQAFPDSVTIVTLRGPLP